MAAQNNPTFKISGSAISIEDVSEFERHFQNNREIWEKAFEWLKGSDLSNIKTGRYDLDKDRLFAMVSEYQTRPVEEIRFEAHRKYIDIQYVIKGREKIGVARLINAKLKIPYNDDKDIAFYDIPESDCRYYNAGPDKYFIFFPGDLHKPGIRVGEGETVRKVVVKVKFDNLRI